MFSLLTEFGLKDRGAVIALAKSIFADLRCWPTAMRIANAHYQIERDAYLAEHRPSWRRAA